MVTSILQRPTYDVLPELLDKERLYEITGMARQEIIKGIKDGYVRRRFAIVFYGGYASNINRRDVSAMRHICGSKRHVYARLKEMEFKTWMDFRIYHFIPNEDFTYGKIGKPHSIPADYLLEMATFIPKRKKLAMLKKSRIWANRNPDNPALIQARERFKEKVDSVVAKAIRAFQR